MADEPKNFHMTPDEFRRWGRAAIDWIADYWERVESYPVLSQASPGDVRAALPDEPPARGESFDAILRDLERVVIPGVTHWQSPNFFAFFPCNGSGPAVLGELISAGLGVQGMLWATSPACTELETHVLDWIVELMGLPDGFRSQAGGGDRGGGVIQDTASTASLCALIAARERATAGASNRAGCDRSLLAYTSTQAHSSIDKAVAIAGLGRDNLRLVATGDGFAMDPGALADAIDADRAAGRVPCFACATVGTTSSGAIDPLRAIGQVCRDRGVWLHVDAAMAGTAAVCPEFRHILDGLELADSYAFNPHKWMFTSFDCNCMYVSDRRTLIEALTVLPEFLRNRATESGAVIDYRDWQIPLGRRFRALKLWFVLRHYGAEGLQHHVREHVALAREFADRVRADEHLELAVEPPLNLVCFRHVAGDGASQAMMDRLNDSGALYLSHTRLAAPGGDRLTLRFSIGQTHTRREHVDRAWERIAAAARAVA